MGFENVIKRHRFSIQLEERSFYGSLSNVGVRRIRNL